MRKRLCSMSYEDSTIDASKLEQWCMYVGVRHIAPWKEAHAWSSEHVHHLRKNWTGAIDQAAVGGTNGRP